MQLTANEVRVLGALIEKEATTPDVYPLSLNALTAACNQTSNRDPVMELSEEAVRNAVNNLRQQSLVRGGQAGGSRVMKFQQLVGERLELDAPLLGALCVLMLRGPQTPGEIRTRATRLATYVGVEGAEAALAQLRAKGLVVELPRRPGQKEARWAHVLSGAPAVDVSDALDRAGVGEEDRELRPTRVVARDDRIAALEATVSEVQGELVRLRMEFEALRRQLE